MNKEQVIAELNAILSLEYTAVLQYTYQSIVVRGLDMSRFLPMFQAEAAESLTHARLVGEKIVALGGIPTAEVHPIDTTTDTRRMLENDLRMETEAAKLYAQALSHAEDDVALRVMLENQVEAETASVEALKRLLA
ncbi:ferritin-like domain-containing protein [bacterium]|jgi:bacterioferritin|nr:ferritin-like domain-containing protein [bacterium]